MTTYFVGIGIGVGGVIPILKEAGLEPAPGDKHIGIPCTPATFSVEAGLFGPVRHMVFFVIEVKTRVVEIAHHRALVVAPSVHTS